MVNIKWDSKGLIPCVVQSITDNQVLMLAYMNKESFKITLETKEMHYFSRSKNRIWKKGESSGNIQTLVELILDCDSDTLLAKVLQKGEACHTGNKTCFYKNNLIEDSKQDNTHQLNPTNQNKFSIKKYGIIDTLYHIILERINEDPEKSYTASLYKKGENAIAKKVIEECGEFLLAFKDRDSKEIIHECSDMVYHVLVALSLCDISPDRIKQELIKRLGISGIEEKNSRTNK